MSAEVPVPKIDPRAEGVRPRLALAGDAIPHDSDVTRIAPAQGTAARHVRRGLRVRIGLSLATAAVVGATVTLWGPFEYLCGATLTIVATQAQDAAAVTGADVANDDSAPALGGSRPAATSPRGKIAARRADVVESLRQALLDHVWQQLGPSEASDSSSMRGWFVKAVNDDSLRLGIRTTNRELAVEKARVVAESFVQVVAESRRALRESPTEGEAALSEGVEQLRRRLETMEMGLAETLAVVPPGNPTDQQQALLTRWNETIQRYRSAKADFDAASREATRLGRSPVPMQGLPTAEERRAAQLADDALQQDLRELEVNLAELRRELLDVSQRCAGPLNELVGAVAEAKSAARRFQEAVQPLGAGSAESELVAAMEAYADEVSRFASAFSEEQKGLAEAVSNPMAARTAESHEALRAEGSRYLFESGKRLSRLRTAMRSTGESTPDVTAFHVSQSDLARAFQRVQQAHHRLEFSLGAFDPRDNFRIDRAVRSAKGLHRRCRDRIERLDQALADKALDRARVQHAARMAAAEQHAQTLRDEVDAAIGALLDLQSEINQGIGPAQSFVRSSIRAELLEEQAGTTRADLERMDTSLTRLQRDRLARAGEAELTLTQCGILDGPVDLPRRMQLGGIAALISCAGIMLGSWWLQQR